MDNPPQKGTQDRAITNYVGQHLEHRLQHADRCNRKWRRSTGGMKFEALLRHDHYNSLTINSKFIVLFSYYRPDPRLHWHLVLSIIY
jgi:hypothetical protein